MPHAALPPLGDEGPARGQGTPPAPAPGHRFPLGAGDSATHLGLGNCGNTASPHRVYALVCVSPRHGASQLHLGIPRALRTPVHKLLTGPVRGPGGGITDPRQPAGHDNPCPATAREVLTGSLSQAFSNFGGLLLTPGVPGLGAASPPICTSISSVLRLSPSVPCKDIVLGAACSGATVVSRFCLQRSCLPTRSPSQVPETGLQRISCTDTPQPSAVSVC